MTMDVLGRAFDLYRRTAASRTTAALIVANAIPLLGVLFFGWSLFTILVLYWLENGIVGFWNVPKIILARGSLMSGMPGMSSRAAYVLSIGLGDGRGTLPGAARFAMAAFFLLHYGIFWIGHGIFVLALPTFAGAFAGGLSPLCPPGGDPFGLAPPGACNNGAFGEVVWSSVGLAAIALFLSHGASFLFNYLGRGEYLRASPFGQVTAPYGRVVVLHLTILIGAFVTAILGAPVGMLVVLVILKTVLDLRLHLRERDRYAPPIAEPASS